MIPTVVLCALVRCNLPLAIGIVWISNPITMAPMMYFGYLVGTFLLGEPAAVEQVDFSLDWLATQVSLIWLPLIVGCLTVGSVLGIIGFTIVRLYWRWRIARYWAARKRRGVYMPSNDTP